LKDEENVVASQKLNAWAWSIHEGTNDKKLLKKARDWAKLSVKKDETFYNLDTYAALLYKTGNKEKALTYYKKAVKAADKYGEDPAQQKEMIKKIEKELDD
jgi:thioredoxin 1